MGTHGDRPRAPNIFMKPVACQVRRGAEWRQGNIIWRGLSGCFRARRCKTALDKDGQNTRYGAEGLPDRVGGLLHFF